MSDNKGESSCQKDRMMRIMIQSLLEDGIIVENSQAQTSLTRQFLHNLDKANWKKLQSLGMLCIKTFQNVCLERDFLHVAISFQDPYEHVFWINAMELCPLYEELKCNSKTHLYQNRRGNIHLLIIKYLGLGIALLDISP